MPKGPQGTSARKQTSVREGQGARGGSRQRLKRRARASKTRALGLKLGVWTVDDARTMHGFKRLGVDAIVTDRPDRLADLS